MPQTTRRAGTACALLLCGAAMPAAAQTLKLEPVATGLASVVSITNAGDGSGRLFLTQQTGIVRLFDGTRLLAAPFLDIRPLVLAGGERGLLSVAFDPAYVSNRRLYVDYTNGNGDIVVARYLASAADANVADPTSAQVLLTIPHPSFGNHNGGQLQFGPDGFLYIGTGDGGGGGDPFGNAQNLSVLLGKILRIDVSGATGYTIPPTNPFATTTGARGEIWDYGLRNPWRFSFDRATGDLLIGDVGQDAFEEIDFEATPSAGGFNYGWNAMEGRHCFRPATGCDTAGLELPILEYSHAFGCAVVGGYRYRGGALPAFDGTYFYSDFCSGTIWGATQQTDGTWSSAPLLQAGFDVSAFGEDETGELYVADYAASGGVFRLVPMVQVTSLTASVSFPVVVGTPVTWTATVTGGLEPFEYRFWRFDVTSGMWTILRDYAASSTFVWTPTAADVGDHRFRVWVRHVGSSAAREAGLPTAVFTVTPSPPVVVSSLTADVSFPVAAGTPVTWTATASSASGALEYRFWRFDVASGIWTILRDYQPANSFVWTPAAADVGNHRFRVWVRHVGASVSREAGLPTAVFTVLAFPPVTVTSLTASTPFPVTVGTPVTWTATATTASGSLAYRFWRFDVASGVWTILRDYQPVNTFVWTPTTADIGDHAFRVWVRHVGSTAAREAGRPTGTFTVLP